MLRAHSYFGELANISLFPVKCRKGLIQIGSLSSLGLYSVGRYKAVVIVESINP